MWAILLAALVIATADAQPPARWRLVEEWRVGGEPDGPHSFTDVRGLGVLGDGRIVVLDAKDQQVHFLSASGKPLVTVGRKGAGPGEFQRANGLAVSPKGEIVINDPSTNRLTMLSASGALLRTIPIRNPWGWGYLWDAYFNARGLLDEYVSIQRAGESTVEARRVWSADFATIDTAMPRRCPEEPRRDPSDYRYSFRNERGGMTMSIPHAAPRLPTVRGPDGAAWSGRAPTYNRVSRIRAGECAADVTIELPGPAIPIPGAMRDSAVALVQRNAAKYGAPTPDLSKIPRSFTYYDALFLDPVQRLWVERPTAGERRRFEVYSTAGALLAHVETSVILSAYRPVAWTRDRIFGFVADADDVLHLVALRIQTQP